MSIFFHSPSFNKAPAHIMAKSQSFVEQLDYPFFPLFLFLFGLFISLK